ncbi:beta-glucan synthesis-associated protein-domain-containing protein [Lineolata rhizophorae]|uniref:Beta-glucan synthesis-associated protein-domain-containing protein n=1 Tax=Lineolata rhizophorae TaxID=578093 RepID=A0A6A6P902_9PEZI|nr:beta-glucan synthesis-associated protein-domain-containing protein [Lineolata rhizophorae]
MASQSSPRRNAPPHIRLNSGQDVIVYEDDSAAASSRPPPLPQTSSRSLIPGPASPSPLYAQPGSAAESAELLLPPQKSRTRRYRDESPDMRSPSPSPSRQEFSPSSRRTSWSSETSRESRVSPFASPFDDSRAPSRAGSDDEGVNTQTVSEKYNILPSAGLLLFPEDVEKDDYLHNPDPNDKEVRDCDLFSRRAMVNVGGLIFLTLGLLFMFIGYPVFAFFNNLVHPQPVGPCVSNPLCIELGRKVPLLENVRRGLVDPDTPDSVMTRKNHEGKTQKLVFSDEFNTAGRTFYDDDDPYWQAVDIWYGVTQDLEWYDPDAATTKDGVLTIRFDAFQNHGLNYRSAMLQSWNKLCFKGGHMEASISLPGRGDTIGFWPGFWAMGNLGRPGYAATTDGMWPYTYHDECDAGITKNQSQVDGLSSLPGMRLPACTCRNEDHPNPGKSRSAPEIDALEASVAFLDPPHGAGVGSASQSLQVAPFDIFWRPDYDFTEVYDKTISGVNGYAGGVFQQALSVVSNLNNDWYDDKAYQTYAFDYRPGDDGYVHWYIGDVDTWHIDGRALGHNGNVGPRPIPTEPMAMIVNFGMSNGFAELNLTGLAPLMPATMRVDYIRIYQDEGEEMMTCDPPEYPTTSYIAQHPEPYANPNMTLWEQTRYDWPKNSLVDGCDT